MPRTLDALGSSQRLAMAAGIGFTAIAGVTVAAGAPDAVRFVVSAFALAALAALVGQSIEQIGERIGPGPTGLLQSSLGNLPELFVAIFALRAHLTQVVQAALVGSVLGNVLLVLGAAFLTGGARHGPQSFKPAAPRMLVTLLTLAVGATLVPTLAVRLGAHADHHITVLSDATAAVLLLVYLASIPFWLGGGPELCGPEEDRRPRRQLRPGRAPAPALVAGEQTPALALPVGSQVPAPSPRPAPGGPEQGPAGPVSEPEPTAAPSVTVAPVRGEWPLGLAITVLVASGLASAFVSDWFVGALTPATKSLGINPEFTGLVIVAIASNAVENSVGIRFAWKARPDYAISTILNSPLQITLFLTPVLVLISPLLGGSQLTMDFPLILVAALAVAVVVVAVVLLDGEYSWLEGVALLALYVVIATSVWWGL